jgi:hypothetical protein
MLSAATHGCKHGELLSRLRPGRSRGGGVLINPILTHTLVGVPSKRWRSMAAAEQRVAQVKAMCQIARGCAQVIAVGDLSDPRYEYEKETYQKRKLRAIQITKLIEDRFHFETALHSIIDLCVAANEMDDAGKLFKMISVDAIRQSILQSHPMLERPA